MADEETYDIKDAISRIMKGEKCDSKENLDISVNSLLEILKRLEDKNLFEEYNEAVRGMANQINLVFASNLITLKRVDIERAIKKRLSYEDYKKLMKSAINQLSKKQKGWKVIAVEKKVKKKR